jgi:hypothetical protein
MILALSLLAGIKSKITTDDWRLGDDIEGIQRYPALAALA